MAEGEHNGFRIRSRSGISIRFQYLEGKAPSTCRAFRNKLPFKARAVQARFAGEEIWVPKGPLFKVRHENALTSLRPGELGYAPPARDDIARSIAIVYGKAKLSGRVNVFGKVVASDLPRLKRLGQEIWLRGAQMLRFEIEKCP